MAVQLDLREKGAMRNGERITFDARLFMQFLAFGACAHVADLVDSLKTATFESVLYTDLNDPRGVGLLTWNRNPDFFVTTAREFLLAPPFSALALKPEFTMFGRTYAVGHEANLEVWLFEKPRHTVLNPDWRWAIWYPLRRSGTFSGLPSEEKGSILSEHGRIGHAFGEADYAHDVRLACFGLDKNDNDFVIGLLGRELYPLSACVQEMRKTQQTSRYIQSMGPFFVGKAIWQSRCQKE
jgi:hypothetical protein